MPIDIKLCLSWRIFDQNQGFKILNHLSIHDRMGQKPYHAIVLFKQAHIVQYTCSARDWE
jgi:hypothetical protein